jgi:phosphatidylinositol alpha-1,6-mannosyltransferase
LGSTGYRIVPELSGALRAVPVTAGKACLLVTNIFPPAIGGSAQVYAALAGFGDIAVLTSSRDHDSGRERAGWRECDRQAGYPIHRLTCIRPFLRKGGSSLFYRLHETVTGLKLIAAVIALALRHQVKAICIADDETVGWLVLLSRYVLGRRTLIYCHGDDLVCGAKEVKRRSRWLRLANNVVAANRHAGALLAERFGVPQGRIAVIPNGVDLALFQPRASEGFRRQHGLEGRKVLLSLTRLVPRKGVDRVIEALPAIAARFADVIYVVVGDGPQAPALRSLAQVKGVEDRVRFVGPVAFAETADFYNAADIVLLPNRAEAGEADGLPLVFLEANACAKPVIGGMAGGTAEVVHQGENGLVIDGNDVGAVETSVCELLADDDRRMAMGQAGLKMAQGWGWQERARAFVRLCREG